MTVPRFALLLLVAFATQLAFSTPATVNEERHWVASWTMAPQAVAQGPATPAFNRAPAINNETVRQIVVPSVSGEALRLRISNEYGKQAVHLGKVTVGIALRGAQVRKDSLHTARFDGQESASVPPGGALVSDSVHLPIHAGEPLAVSIYIPEVVAPATWHKLASQVNFISATGDHTMDAAGTSFARRFTAYVWLDGVDAHVTRRASAVVAIGDSITDGMRSTLNANRRWPDDLSRRLRAAGLHDVAVLDAGISGGRLLHDSPCYGEKLVRRFARDALDLPNVQKVIVLIGINDINFGYVPPHAGLDCDTPHRKVNAAELIAGYRDLIAQAHHRGITIYGGTITPAGLPPQREAIRQQVNAWIRSSAAFDGVIDFDAALRDRARPTRLRARYDSGDHVHPNDAGYAAMAQAVPLDLITDRRYP
ncbi:SGNH/GDSL hydrolase family protein [Thiomonas sp. FB-Cd]|uniref:SGNH/GDSL hydrolase family protein n=1 Tax=Thiomonas sp. FB-Cd TaxID=1158292 RepID=UPI0004DF7E90|nr:SGNH/GDSL hydrolase family protein [Thiomonas sp. FB-Cd]